MFHRQKPKPDDIFFLNVPFPSNLKCSFTWIEWQNNAQSEAKLVPSFSSIGPWFCYPSPLLSWPALLCAVHFCPICIPLFSPDLVPSHDLIGSKTVYTVMHFTFHFPVDVFVEQKTTSIEEDTFYHLQCSQHAETFVTSLIQTTFKDLQWLGSWSMLNYSPDDEYCISHLSALTFFISTRT